MKKAVSFTLAALMLSATPVMAFANTNNDHSHQQSATAGVSSTNTNKAGVTASGQPSQDSLTGLQNQLGQVKNPKALAVLQALMAGNTTTAATQVNTADGATVLNSIESDSQDSKTQKKQVFDALEQSFAQGGDLTDATQAATDSVAADPTDVTAFQRLGALKAKSGNNGIDAYVNGQKVSFDQKPFVKDGRTMVPIRAIAESLGAQVGYDQSTGTITLTKDGITITLTLGSNQATVNGKTVTLDVPANVYGNRTFVPARFVSEGFGGIVQWISGGIVDIVNQPPTTTDSTTTDGTTSDGATTTTTTTGGSTTSTSPTTDSSGTTSTASGTTSTDTSSTQTTTP